MSATTDCLGMFAKYWRPGDVKTRLAASVGQVNASQLYRAFLVSQLERLSSLDVQRVLAFTPADHRNEFSIIAPGWELVPQTQGDLGSRMDHFFRLSFATGARRVVLVGSDSPTLPVEYVRQAFELLETYPVVLGPSSDGGYYLVGARDQSPPIFTGITWSSPSVWSETVEILQEAQIEFGELPAWYDVDDADDLQRLHVDLLTHTTTCEAHRELLAAVEHAVNDDR